MGFGLQSRREPSTSKRMGESRITILDQVARLITRLAPEPACDDCIADRLDLADRQYASQKTRELAATNGFSRRKNACSLCGATKLVIAKC